jgi:hypothetical protein
MQASDALHSDSRSSRASGSGNGSSSPQVGHMLLLRNPKYWAHTLPVTASTHLWSACHDGTSTRLTSLNVPTLSNQHDDSDSSSSSSSGGVAADAAGSQPWYLSPLTSNSSKLEALQHYAATALLREALDCLKGQLQVMQGQHSQDPADRASSSRVSGSTKRWFTASHTEPLEAHRDHPAPLPHLPQQQQQQQQQAQRGGSGLLALLQKAFNTAVLLLVVFAAGRFWPQLSELLAANPSPAGGSGTSSSSSSSTAAREAGLHGTGPHHPHSHNLPPLAPTAGYSAAAAGGHFMMREGPDHLSLTSPTSAPPSLPSAPTTPARATAPQDSQGPNPLICHGPGGLGLSLKPGPPGGLNPGLAPGLDGLRSLSTAASIDQLQMDNAQLAELVSQLHSEVGGSRAAAADATAAVRRQQVGHWGVSLADRGEVHWGLGC